MIELAIKTVLAWLLGSLVGSLVLARWGGGPDIRTQGSGNAGSTNAWRTRGARFGLVVLAIDAGKGWLAVRALAPASLHLAAVTSVLRPNPMVLLWMPAACGAAVVVGHVYPVWFGLRGGKGMATVVGVVAGLAPMLLIPLAVAWVVVLALCGFVGLASMVSVGATAAWQQAIGVTAPLNVFLWTATLFMIFTHRQNIARMRAGTEPRLRLWGRLRH